MSKKGTSGRVKKVHPDVQNLPTNDTNIFNTELNETDIYEEEDALQKMSAHFPKLIKDVLGAEGLYDDAMIARIILEMKKNNLTFLTKKEMLAQHRKMLKKRDAGGDIWEWASYFVGGIIKNRLSETSAMRQIRLSEASKFNTFTEKPVQKIPFYNWLEE